MKNFIPDEFECEGVNYFHKMDQELLVMLDKARDIAGIVFTITSSFRTIDYSKKKGYSLTSPHTMGMAVDISAPSSGEKWTIINAVIHAGFRRIGVGSNFIHVDSDKSKPQKLIWTY